MNAPRVRRALVTGASGVLGPAVVRDLTARGWIVRTLTRHAPEAGLFAPGVECLIGDVAGEDVSRVSAAVEQVDAVLHLAALLHVADPRAALQREYERVNVLGTARLLEAAAKAGVRRVVLASTVNVYGSPAPGVLTEETPPDPRTPYARTKLEAERLVLSARDPQGTVLRLAAVYGGRIKGNYHRLLRAVAARRFVGVGAGTNRRALIHERDAASALSLAAAHPRAERRVFNVSDGSPHTMRAIIAAMAEALGVRPPALRVPVSWARTAAGLVENASRFAGRQPPVTRATINTFTEDILVDTRRVTGELGFAPMVTLTEGWRDVVLDLRQRGELR